MRLLLFVLLYSVSATVSAAFEGTPQQPQVGAPILQPYNVNSIISYARTLLGTPYRYGGMTRRGIDCSGLMNVVYEAHGLELDRSALAIHQQCSAVEMDALQPGDFLFFKGRNIRSSRIGHIALVSGVDEDGKITIIHATRRGVVEDVLQEQSYYTARLMSAGRKVDFVEAERLASLIPMLGTGPLLRM